jgi:hypothetical protein
MLITTGPTIVCIPWQRIKLTGCFIGTTINTKYPIYWADVPHQVKLVAWPHLALFPEEKYHQRWMLQQVIECLVAAEEAPLIVFSDEERSLEIVDKLTGAKVLYGDEPLAFKIYHSGNEKSHSKNRTYFQKISENHQLQMFPCSTPLQFPAYRPFRKM